VGCSGVAYTDRYIADTPAQPRWETDHVAELVAWVDAIATHVDAAARARPGHLAAQRDLPTGASSRENVRSRPRRCAGAISSRRASSAISAAGSEARALGDPAAAYRQLVGGHHGASLVALARSRAQRDRRSPDRGVAMNRRLYHAALGGLAVVLLLLAGFGVVSARRTDRVARHASAATQLSDIYEQARFAVGEEESLERKYRLEPGPDVRAKHARAGQDLSGALVDVSRVGTPADRAFAARVLGMHSRYLEALDRMFAAVDARDADLVLSIDNRQVDPRFAVIVDEVAKTARTHRQAAAESLRQLRGTEHSVLVATPVVFALGLLLLAFLTWLLTRVNHQLARHARESEHNAVHDALTGLPNRSAFADRTRRAIASARRDPASLSVLVIDVDRFREINETLGHTTGDRLLCEISDRLARTLGPADTLARLTGDEFALLLVSVGIDEARATAGRVLTAIREPFAVGELSLTIDASIGIATYPTHGVDVETLLQRADVAMNMVKAGDRGVAVYDPVSDPYDPQRLLLFGELRRAIGEDELELHYQPKFTTADLRLAGVEALVRWRHPTRGLVPPGDFIALAEHTGLIRPLTLLVLRKAVRQGRLWRDQGLDVAVAVNLSLANLVDAELVDDVAAILAEERVAPSGLELEITESTIMTDPERAIATLDRLAAMGIGLSLDDYGTGHSSLAHLRRLPVHELKLDRSFIQHLTDEGDDLAIVRSTIDLGHNLGLRVVAEGVEDARSLALLVGLNCDLAQGFHLGRPVPPDVLLAQLRPDAAAA
jgi:diguanylate cyclase (GGDEF)-like protein